MKFFLSKFKELEIGYATLLTGVLIDPNIESSNSLPSSESKQTFFFLMSFNPVSVGFQSEKKIILVRARY